MEAGRNGCTHSWTHSSDCCGGSSLEALETYTRLLVLRAIKEQPRNAQQMAQLLQLDYTTVRHHLGVLEKNRLIITEGERYGKLYFLSEVMEANWPKLEEIVSKTQKK